MRDDGPSLTARGVAVARLRLERPSTPTGDPAADERLAAMLADGFERARDGHGPRSYAGFGSWVAARTRFFDDMVLRAIATGVPQVVLLGAGYDGRALRFRTPGVTYFEVDHPATQSDKRERLARIAAPTDNIVFVAADFNEPGLGAALEASGHDRNLRSLFICEGVLRYLPETSYRELLRVAAAQAAPASEFAVSISTSSGRTEHPDYAQRERFLAEAGEPVLTLPERDVALAWLAEAGWSVQNTDEVSGEAPGSKRGRLLVRATRSAQN
jgi:methyltransferase (TIGR00027 family)